VVNNISGILVLVVLVAEMLEVSHIPRVSTFSGILVLTVLLGKLVFISLHCG
jgi:hypothetical protein